MESQLPRTHGHHYESTDLSANPSGMHSGVEDHSEGHHEKPSVLEKVKAKAKKIKNTLTKHGHDHDHNHDHGHSHSHDEYDEDEDEEMVEDPEVHGSPIYESEAVRGATRASGGHPTTGGTNLDWPSMFGDPRDSTKPVAAGGTNFIRPSMLGDPHHDSTKPVAAGGTNFDRPSMFGDPHHDSTKPVAAGGTNFDRPSMLGDPHHDSTKPVAAGGTNFDRPSMFGDPHHDSTKPVAAGGTNFDRPSMLSDPHHDSTKPTNLDRPWMVGGHHYDSTKHTAGGINLDRPSMVGPHYDSPFVDPETRPFAQWQADEKHGKHPLKEDKLVDTRSGEDIYPELPRKGINTRTGRDVREERNNPDQLGGPNAMEGIRGGIGTTEVDPQGPNIRAHPSNVQVKTIDPAGRGSEGADGITPVIKSFDRMGISEETQKAEQEKGQYTGSHDQFAPEPMALESSESVPKSYNAANTQDMPGDIYDPDSKSSSYTEKITSASAAAASAIAGTALSAKNVIASKIEQMREPGEGNKSGSATGEGNKSGSVMGTASDYAHKIAATVTDTLAPVYGKVVGVGSGASSKVSGLGAETTQETGRSAGQDRGVSVKEYWVEKLKPGEEDRALSSMITESFNKPKGEKMEEAPTGGGGGGGRSISQIVSDAVHKREPEEGEERKPMGKVTESEEVAKRLGTGEEGTGLENIGTGAGVVNKLTGAIGSWLGGQGGRAKSTPGTTLGKMPDAQGERRLQESSN
ncbi:hypothetical protein POM88_009401 [Heracleum sosnowskyi]|uniref:Low-temperature-induced 65 kDa protein n=1 Tax=Heracleum sosnowskyi TaxID=360622 RepID=A0AAD8JAJ5_9APIA|nr:hypothetical protein POM88_009401 [Heracleum sosnowskyi]